jgi:hypothetical protein
MNLREVYLRRSALVEKIQHFGFNKPKIYVSSIQDFCQLNLVVSPQPLHSKESLYPALFLLETHLTLWLECVVNVFVDAGLQSFNASETVSLDDADAIENALQRSLQDIALENFQLNDEFHERISWYNQNYKLIQSAIQPAILTLQKKAAHRASGPARSNW